MNDIVVEILRWLIGLIAIAWGGLFLVFCAGDGCSLRGVQQIFDVGGALHGSEKEVEQCKTVTK